jgi:glycosyltransferase involved in cell wall biosynthesis
MIPGSILFITRNYPPKVGGLEKYSLNLIEAFVSHTTTHKITLSKSKKHLLWFFPFALVKALFVIRKFSVSRVHLCDGLLAPVGLLLKRLTGKTVTATVHGLDVTYGNSLYQKIIPWCIEKLDRIVCVSRSTREEVFKRTRVLPENCVVIPNGIMPDEMVLSQPKRELLRKFEALTGLTLGNRKILFTLGHLVKRKGVEWFAANVMPRLPEDYVYLVAGDGPEKDPIEKVIAFQHLQKRVFLLGEISNEMRNILYNLSDIFVMPNITVPNDVEGFGIVALEAGSCGLPVVATNIQGIRAAVIDGKTGYLIQEGQVQGFLERIQNMSLEKKDVRFAANETFAWSKIYGEYRTFLFS